MRLTEPTKASKAHDRIQKRLHKDLRKFVRANGGTLRTRAHSKAAERGASR